MGQFEIFHANKFRLGFAKDIRRFPDILLLADSGVSTNQMRVFSLRKWTNEIAGSGFVQTSEIGEIKKLIYVLPFDFMGIPLQTLEIEAKDSGCVYNHTLRYIRSSAVFSSFSVR